MAEWKFDGPVAGGIVSARSLAASVAPLAQSAVGYDERSTQANIPHVENPRRGSCDLVTPGICDVPGTTGATLAQQEINWCDEVASKMGILSVATSSSLHTDPACPGATAVDEPHSSTRRPRMRLIPMLKAIDALE